MSIEYDEYLKNHINNVQNAITWMYNNLNLGTNNYMFSHDNSKYSSDEYDPYDMYFYGGNKSYKVKRDFDYAWLHHIHNNPHHWQYWILFEDDPDTGKPYRALEMPKDYVIEMIADWWSFSWKDENLREIFDWYDKHKNKMILHGKTRKLVEDILSKIKTVLDVQERVKENDVDEEHIQHSDDFDEDKAQKYGIPELKKYPMPDEDHVRSAIRFFNYVDPKYEQELAEAIIERAEEYGFDLEKDISVGDENRFKKYISQETHLEHHGIKDQKWGIRNGPPYPLKNNNNDLIKKYTKENLKNSDISNLSKWGNNENTNCLYISGVSGSGKSTVALGLANDGDTVIHLDSYTEPDIYEGAEENQNPKFNLYLNEHLPDWQYIYMDKDKNKAKNKDYWTKVDDFRKSIEDYSKNEFSSGHKVIVEGVQITNGWLTSDNEYLNDKPNIYLRTDIETANKRAQERDSNE